jgi:hypothetical protein
MANARMRPSYAKRSGSSRLTSVLSGAFLGLASTQGPGAIAQAREAFDLLPGADSKDDAAPDVPRSRGSTLPPHLRWRNVSLLRSPTALLAQANEPPDPGGQPVSSRSREFGALRSYSIPAFEILGFDFLLNRYNHRFSGSNDYNVTASTISSNFRGSWVTDNDPFSVNQFAHPYQGSMYHGFARSAGLGYWAS